METNKINPEVDALCGCILDTADKLKIDTSTLCTHLMSLTVLVTSLKYDGDQSIEAFLLEELNKGIQKFYKITNKGEPKC